MGVGKTLNYNKMKKVFFLVATGLAIITSSCQSSNEALQRAAATSIGNTLSNEVVVSNVKRGATNVSWDAKKGNKCYKCEADDMVRKTNCVEVECDN